MTDTRQVPVPDLSQRERTKGPRERKGHALFVTEKATNPLAPGEMWMAPTSPNPLPPGKRGWPNVPPKRRRPQRPPRSLPQQSKQTLTLAVDLWSVGSAWGHPRSQGE